MQVDSQTARGVLYIDIWPVATIIDLYKYHWLSFDRYIPQTKEVEVIDSKATVLNFTLSKQSETTASGDYWSAGSVIICSVCSEIVRCLHTTDAAPYLMNDERNY